MAAAKTRAKTRTKSSVKGGAAKKPKPVGKPRGKAKKRGERTTAVSRAQRNGEIYRDKLRGFSFRALGEHYGMTERQIEKIVGELREGDQTIVRLKDPLLPMKHADEMILQRTEAVSEAAELCAWARKAGNYTVLLGAMRQRDDALDRWRDLLVDLDLLPRTMGVAMVQREGKVIAEVGMDILYEAGLPDEMIDRFVEAIQLRTGRSKATGRLELDLSPEALSRPAKQITVGQEEGEVVDGEVVP